MAVVLVTKAVDEDAARYSDGDVVEEWAPRDGTIVPFCVNTTDEGTGLLRAPIRCLLPTG